MATLTSGSVVPHARQFSSHHFRCWQEISLGDVSLTSALCLLSVYKIPPTFCGVGIRLDYSGVANATTILKENAPK